MQKLQLTKEQSDAINQKRYKNKLFALWYRIAFLQDTYGYCSETNPELAKKLRISKRSIASYINELEDLGLIKRVKADYWHRRLYAIRPNLKEEKIEEKQALENANKVVDNSNLETENTDVCTTNCTETCTIYINNSKYLNYENNLSDNIVSNESLSESEALTLVTEELKKKYPTEIVAEALRIYLFKKMEQKIYSVEKYIIGICKNLIKNKKSRIRKIYKRRKREEFEEQQQQKFKQMAQDKAEREQDSNYVMFNEMTTARYERMNVQITDDMYFDWMNELEEETIEEPQTGLVDKFAPYQTIIFKL